MVVRLVVLGVAFSLSVACGSRPIPLQAQAGSTFVLMVPGDFEAGFGRTFTPNVDVLDYYSSGPAYDPNSGLEDEQRGELFVRAFPVGTQDLGDPWPVAYMTRLGPSPASPAGLGLGGPANPDQGQIIAFVEIPADTAAGDYSLRIDRKRRLGGAAADVFLGMSPPPEYHAGASYPANGKAWEQDASGNLTWVRITVLANDPGNPEHFNLFEGGNRQIWQNDLTDDLNALLPYPYARIRIQEPNSDPSLIIRPGAAEIEIEYPSFLVDVKGVAIERPARDSAAVRYVVENGAGTSCSDTGTVRVFLVDPDRAASFIQVIFTLKNFADPTCGGPVDLSDFVIADHQFFDENGVEISSITPQVTGIF